MADLYLAGHDGVHLHPVIHCHIFRGLILPVAACVLTCGVRGNLETPDHFGREADLFASADFLCNLQWTLLLRMLQQPC